MNGIEGDYADTKTPRSISVAAELWIPALILPWNKHLSFRRTKNDLQLICMHTYLFNKVKIHIKCCVAYDH